MSLDLSPGSVCLCRCTCDGLSRPSFHSLLPKVPPSQREPELEGDAAGERHDLGSEGGEGKRTHRDCDVGFPEEMGSRPGLLDPGPHVAVLLYWKEIPVTCPASKKREETRLPPFAVSLRRRLRLPLVRLLPKRAAVGRSRTFDMPPGPPGASGRAPLPRCTADRRWRKQTA